jgi:GT2 family glycosyltransferase
MIRPAFELARNGLWAVSPNYDGRVLSGLEYVRSTFKDGGLAGFAFMVRGEIFDQVSFDEAFSWWYGDDDFVAQVQAQGGRTGIVGEATVEHVGGGAQTVRYRQEVLAAIERDRRRMWSKWGHF